MDDSEYIWNKNMCGMKNNVHVYRYNLNQMVLSNIQDYQISWKIVIIDLKKKKETYTFFNISRFTKKWFVNILFQYVLAIDYIYPSSPFHNIVFLASDIEHLSKESSKNYTVFISYFSILIWPNLHPNTGTLKWGELNKLFI